MTTMPLPKCQLYTTEKSILMISCARDAWMRSVLGTKLSNIASNALMSEKTEQQYVERFRQTGSMVPCLKKNGLVLILSEFDEAILVQVKLNKALVLVFLATVGQITRLDTLNCDYTIVSLELLLVERVLCCQLPPICCSEKTIGLVGCLMTTIGFWMRTATGSGSCLVEASTDEV